VSQEARRDLLHGPRQRSTLGLVRGVQPHVGHRVRGRRGRRRASRDLCGRDHPRAAGGDTAT